MTTLAHRSRASVLTKAHSRTRRSRVCSVSRHRRACVPLARCLTVSPQSVLLQHNVNAIIMPQFPKTARTAAIGLFLLGIALVAASAKERVLRPRGSISPSRFQAQSEAGQQSCYPEYVDHQLGISVECESGWTATSDSRDRRIFFRPPGKTTEEPVVWLQLRNASGANSLKEFYARTCETPLPCLSGANLFTSSEEVQLFKLNGHEAARFRNPSRGSVPSSVTAILDETHAEVIEIISIEEPGAPAKFPSGTTRIESTVYLLGE
jgi:hypothetical protein